VTETKFHSVFDDDENRGDQHREALARSQKKTWREADRIIRLFSGNIFNYAEAKFNYLDLSL
ncbi:hypothetical protein, partial [Enterobacter sp. PGRG2]|uniref:hypothetical protein n=1 Tax=Enterobacter sp. PGRG2 TaxID=3104013 RepID=UPI002ABD572E